VPAREQGRIHAQVQRLRSRSVHLDHLSRDHSGNTLSTISTLLNSRSRDDSDNTIGTEDDSVLSGVLAAYRSLLQLALACCSLEPTKRPAVAQAVSSLESVLRDNRAPVPSEGGRRPSASARLPFPEFEEAQGRQGSG